MKQTNYVQFKAKNLDKEDSIYGDGFAFVKRSCLVDVGIPGSGDNEASMKRKRR
jgi:hypothetical protein